MMHDASINKVGTLPMFLWPAVFVEHQRYQYHSSCYLRLLRSPQHQTNPHTGFYTSRDMFIRWWHIAQHIRHKKIAPFSTLGRRGSLSYHEYYDTHIVSFTFTYLYTDIIISKILHVHKRNDVLLDRARAGRHVRGVLKQPSFVPHFFFLTFWRGRSRKIRFLSQPFKFFFRETAVSIATSLYERQASKNWFPLCKLPYIFWLSTQLYECSDMYIRWP